MKFGHHTNTRGVVGSPAGVTSIADLFYVSNGAGETSIREIAAAGYAGVELFDGDIVDHPGGPPGLRALLSELELDLVAVYCGANFIFEDVLGEELARIEGAAAASAELGATHLVVGGGARRRGGGGERDCELLGEALEKVVGIGQRTGLTPSFHPHLGTCAETAEEIGRVLDQTGILLCPDTAHLAAGGSDPAELIRTYGERIEYLHLKDYLQDPFGFVPLGEGELDLRAIAQALTAIGYDDWIMVEADGFPGSAQAAAETSRRYLDVLFGDVG